MISMMKDHGSNGQQHDEKLYRECTADMQPGLAGVTFLRGDKTMLVP
jgi:hypothetical protein